MVLKAVRLSPPSFFPHPLPASPLKGEEKSYQPYRFELKVSTKECHP